ncbi:late embryogenesis abundant protein 31-like, partial [Elaeis guineensis]|uniref:late embryogenesis abundant protein 31-like n=1 Tax=Elaeis guineensis var. tenera TaxID=51953 RepID=UPI003C6D4EC9
PSSQLHLHPRTACTPCVPLFIIYTAIAISSHQPKGHEPAAFPETSISKRTGRAHEARRRAPRLRGPVAPGSERDALLNRDDPGLVVAETDLPGKRLVTASTGGQVVAQFAVPAPAAGGAAQEGEPVTMGEALEAAALTVDGEKKVDGADAAAIQSAEARATGLEGTWTPGGVGSEAQAAAASNARGEEEEVSLRDVLSDATSKIPRDKVVTREDAQTVADADQRNRGQGESEGGVAASVVAASRLNENRKA